MSSSSSDCRNPTGTDVCNNSSPQSPSTGTHRRVSFSDEIKVFEVEKTDAVQMDWERSRTAVWMFKLPRVPSTMGSGKWVRSPQLVPKPSRSASSKK
ncbi:hypothetical protein BDV98DRAFT_606430 [Pterulicium gracile]|uniref:Uncharacterized protein n=1 Tax=Pterulicium gracile TaxID=1884261 RepID=A0A5C3QFM1_9AGAR|nr:hypothetical protein BDV98DRAFT_606430 [Pterula gracilis]